MTPEEEKQIESFILDQKDELLPEYDIINSLRRNERYKWDDIIYCCWAYAKDLNKKVDRLQFNLLKEIEGREKFYEENLNLRKLLQAHSEDYSIAIWQNLSQYKEIATKLQEEIDFAEQNITANMDAYLAFDLARDTVKDFFSNKKAP